MREMGAQIDHEVVLHISQCITVSVCNVNVLIQLHTETTHKKCTWRATLSEWNLSLHPPHMLSMCGECRVNSSYSLVAIVILQV